MEVTLGGIAGLIIAVAILFFLGWVAYKIGAVLDAARDAVKDLTAETTPILSETKGLVTEVTNELVSVRDITDDVAKVSGHATDIADNASQLTSLIAVGKQAIDVRCHDVAQQCHSRSGLRPAQFGFGGGEPPSLNGRRPD